MTTFLLSSGYTVYPKRVLRLLRTMGLEAVYQKSNLSQPYPEHMIYLYLLRSVDLRYYLHPPATRLCVFAGGDRLV